MKLTNFTNLMVLGLVLGTAAVGCRHRPQNVTPLPGTRGGGTPSDAGQAGALGNDTGATGLKGTDLGASPQSSPDERKDWPRDREALKTDTVYFDFDSSVVKSSEKSKVAAVADFLKNNSQDAVQIEGYCDERGTEEYNRALGERRALALRQELIGLGVPANLVDTISFGKDKPADPGHGEEAWHKNRRGEFVVEVHPK